MNTRVDSGTAVHSVPVSYHVDLLDVQAANPARYPYLLESVARGGAQGRFDILFGCPGETLVLDADYQLRGDAPVSGASFLTALDAWWQMLGVPPQPVPGIPFSGGWFLLLGYELAQQVEPSLSLATQAELPVAMAVRIPVAVVRDHHEQCAWVIAEPEHAGLIDTLIGDMHQAEHATASADPWAVVALDEEPPEQFLRAVDTAKAHIAAGDIFQANLSRLWRGRLTPGTPPTEIYRRLRRANPSPFAGCVIGDGFALVSSSPERLIRIQDRQVDTRPIAGTRPRSRSEPDEPRRQELLAHPKERAEHVMLIDLERNDLGRVCEAGSVAVSEFMVVESYQHVHHIVSNVRGRLRAGVTPGQAIAAVFPGGTITGCPKVRCMEIISELEQRPRGFYTGSMGYLNRDGSMDTNILIRSISIAGDDLWLAAGSGIVSDSEPDAELAETRAKAKGMILALA